MGIPKKTTPKLILGLSTKIKMMYDTLDLHDV